jgi:uncharacterized protein (TIGR03086 family)
VGLVRLRGETGKVGTVVRNDHLHLGRSGRTGVLGIKQRHHNSLGERTAMSTTADRFRTVAAGFTERVEATKPEQWDNQSPCDEWKARDVVDHVVGTQSLFLGMIGREMPAGPSVDDDPLAAWIHARDTTQHALDTPEIAQTEFESPVFGKSTYEQSLARIGVADVLTHTWDLARAVGADEKLDPAEVSRAYEALKPMDDMVRTKGVFGPKVEVPESADEQTKYLAFTGREA